MQPTPAILRSVNELTPSIIGLSMVREDGLPFFAFQPGQYATISFPDYRVLRGERSFSIASSAMTPTELEFGVRIGGRYTQHLAHLVAGDRVTVRGPFGSFTLNPERDRSVVLIAGGIGVTPFLSMMRTAAAANWPTDIHLIYSVRSVADAAYLAELEQLQHTWPRLRVVYVVADGKIPNDGRFVAGRLTTDIIAAVTGGQPLGRSYYLCGPPGFMTAVTNLILSFGIRRDGIRRERFTVATSAIIEPGTLVPWWTFAAWGAATAIILGAIIHLEQERRAALLPVTNQSTVSNTTTTPTNVTNTEVVPTNVATTTNISVTNVNTTPITNGVNKATTTTSTNKPKSTSNTTTTPAPVPASPYPRTGMS